MLQTRKIIRIFVSSPDDMRHEREQLGKIVQSVNRSWGHVFKSQFELIRWETHGVPGFGQDAQDLLNKELPDDFEVYIGLMWARFGTPTGRAGSGTEEEFCSAYARFKEDPTSVRIMFYFKETQIPLEDIDPDQLGRVRKFRVSLEEKGGLLGTFKTDAEFQSLINEHLAHVIVKFEDQPSPEAETNSNHHNDRVDNNEEMGIIEYWEIWDETIEKLAAVTNKIAKYTNDHGRQLREHTRETLSAIDEHKPDNVPRKKAKALIAKAANTINVYGDRISENSSEFDAHLREAASSAEHLIRLETSSDYRNIEGLKDTLYVLTGLYDSIVEAKNSLKSFQLATDEIPPMTRELNRAKKKTVTILQQILDSMNAGELIFGNAITTLESAIERGEEPTDE